MKRLLLLSLLFSGCAGTFVKENGQVVFFTQANCTSLHFHSAAGSDLTMTGLNHAVATRAGGSVIGTAASGAAGVIAAGVTKGIIR